MIVLPDHPTGAAPLPSDSLLVLAAWCRRILTSLSKRKLADRASGNLEMLLSYFIEMDPPAAGFAARLAEYADGTRPALAEAAQLLQHAWQGGHGELTMPAPPLQETLRTLGGRLDDAGARAAYLTLASESVQLQTFGDLSQCTLDPLELRLEVASRLALRGHVAPLDPSGPPGYESRLRLIGSQLDAQPAQAYEVFVTPRTIVVEGSAGYYRSSTLDDLRAPSPSSGRTPLPHREKGGGPG